MEGTIPLYFPDELTSHFRMTKPAFHSHPDFMQLARIFALPTKAKNTEGNVSQCNMVFCFLSFLCLALPHLN